MTMDTTRRHLAILAAGAAAAANTLSRPALAQGAAAAQVDAALAEAIGREAYIYGYPLMLMEVTRRQATNLVQARTDYPFGPANRFVRATDFPKPENREVIRPNLDTLYSIAWIDLGDGPMVLSMPATDRFMMLPILSGWTDVFAVPGTRTTGTARAHNFLLLGPGQQATQVPRGLEVIHAPTRMAWTVGRIQTNGRDDFPNVFRIQEGIRLTPLSAWGQSGYTPPPERVDPSIDMRTPPPVQVTRMDAGRYFAMLAAVMGHSPEPRLRVSEWGMRAAR